MSKNAFEELGFFEEYYCNNKMIGVKKAEYDGIRKIGYYGRVNFIAENDIILDNKKKIKKGLEYYTLLYPLCGNELKQYD